MKEMTKKDLENDVKILLRNQDSHYKELRRERKRADTLERGVFIIENVIKLLLGFEENDL